MAKISDEVVKACLKGVARLGSVDCYHHLKPHDGRYEATRVDGDDQTAVTIVKVSDYQ